MRSGTRSGSPCCRSGGSLVSRCPTTAGLVAFFLLATLELCVPLWAEQVGRTAWHPGHIAERYGLFTIIVLGESVLSATVGVQTAIDLDSKFSDLGLVVVGGLLTLFTMWWIYFDLPTEHLVERIRRRLRGAPGRRVRVGLRPLLRVRVDRGHGRRLGGCHRSAGGSLRAHGRAGRVRIHAARVVVRALGVGAARARYKAATAVRSYAPPVAIALILLSTFTSEPVLVTGVVMAVLVGVNVASHSCSTSGACGRTFASMSASLWFVS